MGNPSPGLRHPPDHRGAGVRTEWKSGPHLRKNRRKLRDRHPTFGGGIVMERAGPPFVLLVEDEMCLAMMLQDLLEDAGYRVLKAARVPAALTLAGDADIDAAILDVNVAGSEVFPVADEL